MAIPSGFVRVTLPWVGDAAPTGAANVLCFRNMGDLDAEAIQVLINANADESCFADVSETLSVPTMLIKFGPDETGALYELGCGIEGSDTGAVGAAAPAALIKKSTATGGRKGRGRMYLPGITEQRIDPGGVLVSSFRLTLETDAQNFFADLDTGGLVLAVEHADGSTPSDVTGISCAATLATQRRRQRR
jgi:hypothetical protein